MKQNDAIQLAPLKKYLFQKAMQTGTLLSATFEVSPLCNFNCRMCYIHQSKEEAASGGRRMVTLNEWLALAEKLRQQGTLYILLTGGEPMLWPDFWKLYEGLYRMGFLVSVNTNGSLITAETIDRFRKMPPQQINLTLYGASDETYRNLCGIRGMHGRVTAAIENLQKAGMTVRLNYSVVPENAGDIGWITDFAKKHRLHLESTTYMFPPVRSNPSQFGVNNRFTPEEAAYYRLEIFRNLLEKEEYRQYLQDIQKGLGIPEGLDADCAELTDGIIRCPAGRASCWFTWDGYASICGMMPYGRIDLRKSASEETALKKTDLAKTDAKELESCECGSESAFPENFWEQLKAITEHTCLSGKCLRCENSTYCRACAAMAYNETGNTGKVPEYLCRMTAEIHRLAGERLKKTDV